MKFSEIKKFPFASYRINVSWKYLPEWLKLQKEFFNLQLDPPFQRGYKWNMSQKIAFIEYQLKGGFSGKDIFWNSPNWNGNIKENDPLQLVDGKQRINAVLDFLDNKIKIFGGYSINDFEDKLQHIEPDFKFHINNLKSQLDVVNWYLGLNTGGSIHTKEDLKSAYDYYKILIKK